MVIVTRVSTQKVGGMGEVNSVLTVKCTMVRSLQTKCTVMVSSIGQTVANISVNIGTEKWTVKEFTLGLTGEDMKGSTLKIENMDMECLSGLMANSMKETGKTDNYTEM